MALWHSVRGGIALSDYSEANVARAIEIAKAIPGAKWEQDGFVSGADHTLRACLVAGGALTVRWRSERSDRFAPLSLPLYQRYGTEFIVDRRERGVLCHDDMGLGKTVQAIAALCFDARPVAVICPAFLKTQWKSEIEKWAHKFGGKTDAQIIFPPSDKRSKLPPPKDPSWVVGYYHDAERVIDAIGHREFNLIIDEAHNCAQMKGVRAAAIRELSMYAAGRVLLTGSPLFNKPAKLHVLLDLMSPGDWGNYWQFARRYSGATDGAFGLNIGRDLTNGEELRNRMSMCSFRRVKEDVADQLPFETKFQTVWLDPPDNCKIVHGAVLKSLSGLQAHLEAVTVAKDAAVLEQIHSDREQSVASITFTSLRNHAQRLSDYLGNGHLVLGGGDSSGRLTGINNYVTACKAKGVAPAVVGTMGALGEGANLQFAKVVNLAALDYTPDVLRQVIGRVARMGQTGEVTVRLFAMRHTADEHYVRILSEKLREQQKFHGRDEQSKADLADALKPANVQEALASMLKRWQAEES